MMVKHFTLNELKDYIRSVVVELGAYPSQFNDVKKSCFQQFEHLLDMVVYVEQPHENPEEPHPHGSLYNAEVSDMAFSATMKTFKEGSQ